MQAYTKVINRVKIPTAKLGVVVFSVYGGHTDLLPLTKLT